MHLIQKRIYPSLGVRTTSLGRSKEMLEFRCSLSKPSQGKARRYIFTTTTKSLSYKKEILDL